MSARAIQHMKSALNDTPEKACCPPQAAGNSELFVPIRERVTDGCRPNHGMIEPCGKSLGMNKFNPQKKLVAYFSHSGNTKVVAQSIAEIAGADLYEIRPAEPYPQDYDAVVKQAKIEINAGDRPELVSDIPSLAGYDLLFIGSPNWWNTIAPPVTSFLTIHDFRGKKLVPFITHEGSGLGRSVADIRKCCPDVSVEKGCAFWGPHGLKSKKDVAQWIRSIGLSA